MLINRRGLTISLAIFLAAGWIPGRAADSNADEKPAANAPKPAWLSGKFRWTTGGPLVSPVERPADPCRSIKDPSIVRFDDRWHIFATIRSEKRTHQIEYLSFGDWKEASAATRHVLAVSDGYYCAPQVFYFTPHRKWYLIYQASDPARPVALQPAFSTTDKLADSASWSKPRFLFDKHPENVARWIDFWVICDDAKAHLFFTSNDGEMWRSDTKLADFPGVWSRPQVVLRDDIFEASHTYKLKGRGEYLTLVEAQNGARRYYKAYLADRLDGQWKPLAATRDNAFAAPSNVRDTASHWTDSFSHGELLRAGYDERLEVDPERLQFLYQGVSDAEMRGKKYGDIPWRLGLLTLEVEK